jgi:diphthamide synthase (EF-2-diphthine--ammonia ligase)
LLAKRLLCGKMPLYEPFWQNDRRKTVKTIIAKGLEPQGLFDRFAQNGRP